LLNLYTFGEQLIMKTILILSSSPYGDLKKQPRVLMEVDALKGNYNIMAAGAYGNEGKEAGYEFINTDYFQRYNNYYKKAWLFKKTFSLLIYITSIFRKKLNTEERFIYKFKVLNKYNFDLVIVHQLNDLPFAVELAKRKNAKIIMNAHEYYPKELDDYPEWIKNIQPEYIKICSEFFPKTDAIFAVGEIIANEYKKEFGVESIVITNSKKYQNLFPCPIGKKIRIIHHGGAIRSRGLEEMINMMGILGESYTLDLILVPTEDNQYLNDLKALASNNVNINFRPTVPTAKISEELNNFDIGCYILKPSNFNNLNALPNKFFEFIQGRLALAIGPSPEMAGIVKKYDLGVVAKDFTAQSMADEIRTLTPEKIMYYKNQCHENAYELSSEKDEQLILETVNKILTN